MKRMKRFHLFQLKQMKRMKRFHLFQLKQIPLYLYLFLILYFLKSFPKKKENPKIEPDRFAEVDRALEAERKP